MTKYDVFLNKKFAQKLSSLLKIFEEGSCSKTKDTHREKPFYSIQYKNFLK